MLGRLARILATFATLTAAALASTPAATGSTTHQSGVLTMPDVITQGLTARASVALSPAVKGRVVVLQVRVAGAWRAVARGAENREGLVAWRVNTTLSGIRSFRVRAQATKTLPPYVSAPSRTRIATLRLVSTGPDAAAQPTLSDDGSLVAYVAEDPDGSHWADIRLWRRATGTVEVVTSGDGESLDPALTGDGSQLFFDSTANDLDGEHAHRDLFVHPVDGSGFTRLTSGNANSSFPQPTSDGSLVAFTSTATDLAPDTVAHLQVFVLDTELESIARVTNGNGNSDFPAISDDGSRVVFSSTATDLLGAPGVDGWSDIFSLDAGVTTSLAAGDGDSNGTTMSRDGNTVAFQSLASDLLGKRAEPRRDVFVVKDGTMRRLGARLLGGAQPALSGDGTLIAFAGVGQDGMGRLVMSDLTGSTSYAVLPTAASAPAVSETGRFVVFVTPEALTTDDTDAGSDVYVWDRGY